MALGLVDRLAAAGEVKGQPEEAELPAHPGRSRAVLLPVLFGRLVLGDEVLQGQPGSAVFLRERHAHPAHLATEFPRHLELLRRIALQDRTLRVALELIPAAGSNWPVIGRNQRGIRSASVSAFHRSSRSVE